MDGWRAVAILAVLWHHATMGFFDTEGAYYQSAARMGAFGVDVFFGLSGLLITGLLLKEERKTGAIRLRVFYTKRAFRILPVYLSFLAVVGCLGMIGSFGELAGSVLFFRNYLPNSMQEAGTFHLWSLSIEEHFYLMWPGLLVLCGRKWGRHAAASLAIGVGFWRMLEPQLGLHLFPDVQPHFRTDLRLDALLWGAAVAFTLDDADTRKTLREQLRFWPWVAITGVALLTIAYYSLLTSMFLAVLVPMVLAGTVLHPEWGVSRVLEWPAIAWIGRISYSLYIWQQLFLVPGWEHPEHVWTQWPWNLAAVVAVACASYYWIETPLVRMGARVAARMRTSERVPAPMDAALGLQAPLK